MHTEGFHVAVLIKVGLAAAVVLALEVDDGRVFEPELGELAGFIAFVVDLVVREVSESMHKECTLRTSKSLYVVKSQGAYLGFFHTASCSSRVKGAEVFNELGHHQNQAREGIFVGGNAPLETNQITHGTDCEIGEEVHATSMDIIDKVAPFREGTIVRVEHRKIEGRVT
jgi:hypothetical protein